jgi:hypothetical protein
VYKFLSYLLEEPLYKIGYSKKLSKRLPTYATGKSEDGAVVYHQTCANCKLVEQSLKHKLRFYLFNNNKELVQLELNKLVDIIKETINDLDGKTLKNKVHDIENKISNIEQEIKNNF